MNKKRKNGRISDSKKMNRPKIRFNFWILFIIFVLSFAGCFMLYMVAANLDDDFFGDESSLITQESNVPDSTSASDSDNEIITSESSGEPESPATEIIYPVPQSAAVDASYLENCCLITDSTLLPISSYTDFKDVIGSNELTAVNVGSTKVESAYGTVTPYEAIKLKKPMNVYIMLGSDIGTSSVDDMISSYTSLVSDIKSSLPDTKIYVMQLPPIAADGDTITNALIDEYNSRLIAMARKCGVYCLDTNTDMKANEGSLRTDYFNEETLELTSQYYKDICGYILTHTV